MIVVREVSDIELCEENQSLAKEIIELIQEDVLNGNLTVKTPKQVQYELEMNQWLLAFQGDKLVGCISINEGYFNSLEIRTLCVHRDYRNSGIGLYLVKCMIKKVQSAMFIYKKIIVLPNQNSYKIFKQLGFTSLFLQDINEHLRKVCDNCQESQLFPNCHCKYMELLTVNDNEFEIVEDIVDHPDAEKFYALFRQVTGEPPQLANFTLEYIRKLFKAKRNSIVILVKNRGSVVGYCIGMFVTKQKIQGFIEYVCDDDLYKNKGLGFYIWGMGFAENHTNEITLAQLWEKVLFFLNYKKAVAVYSDQQMVRWDYLVDYLDQIHLIYESTCYFKKKL
jgi:N-acetylglutamate synthase-like GNAT family acetyltransferase